MGLLYLNISNVVIDNLGRDVTRGVGMLGTVLVDYVSIIYDDIDDEELDNVYNQICHRVEMDMLYHMEKNTVD